jgi:hypothetical protein
MTVKLTMHFYLGIGTNEKWRASELFDLSNEDINLTILSLQMLPENYLFFEKNINYDKESIEVTVNTQLNMFELSMLINEDKTVLRPIIKEFINTYTTQILNDYSVYSFNNITYWFNTI